MGTEVEKTEPEPTRITVQDNGPMSILLDTGKFEHLWRISNAFASSDMVPDHCKGKPHNCFVLCQLAIRLEIDPFTMMQSCYVVHGKPGVEAKLAIALCNRLVGTKNAPFRDRIQWEFTGKGKDRECTAFAHDRISGDRCEATVNIAMAQAEGWMSKSGSKWKTMPDVMLRYRSARFLVRFYCEDVMMGLNYTKEELEDMHKGAITVDSEPTKSDEIAEMLAPPEPAAEPDHYVEQAPVEDAEPEKEPEGDGVTYEDDGFSLEGGA